MNKILIFALVYCFLIGISESKRASQIPNTYDPDFSLKMAHYAWAARCQQDTIQSWTCGTPCQLNPNITDVQVFYNSTHHSLGFIGYDYFNQMIVLSFRPTMDNLNWLYDFDYFKINYSYCQGCQVHRGFLFTWNDLRQNVLAYTQFLVSKYPNAPLIITGHSLGAAVSMLAAVEINHYIKKVDYIYNYGQPRVGNKQFADFCESIIPVIYRIIHNRDPVPHVPLQKMGFQHTRTEVWYNKNNTSYQVCKGSEDPQCSDKIKEYLPFDHAWYMGFNIGTDCP
ncbi:lipase family protein (macronuclear) [Tetrahymena thermophila SB210]|uniref:Lipase family protein n=1 Tax=Tetrahymena thermophila (strain SB210) TaxID=312017 RepID=Q23KD8_TETTS|nr:lipase family protein [Tetrahymena thermophila SB210]EAR96905.3 lipase family protein [Tetrahymena thermophila SB210]|eukprot:XP_001017150.3 lipase family protein [Tetrahymena thermophila SB210]